MQGLYAEVVIEKKNWPKDKTLHYSIPSSLKPKLQIGHKVLIPLQRKQVVGYVVGFTSQPEVEKLRNILVILDPLPFFDQNLLKLAYWMKNYYLCTLGDALNCLLPPAVKIKEKKVYGVTPNKDNWEERIEELKKKFPKQAKVLQVIRQNNYRLSAPEVISQAGTSMVPLKNLQEKGLIEERIEEIERNPLGKLPTLDIPLQLNLEQERALKQIESSLADSAPEVFLLHGVTGSGKTEVYLQAISCALKQGKEAIVLVPEISLTPQTLSRFRQRFGDEIAVLHSHLSDGERYDQWRKIKRGEARVVIGARSALFAPLANLGIIIIDEEHESTYKQEENPKYHARELAQKRIELVGGTLVLGTATPSIESYYRTKVRRYRYISLMARVDDKPLPQVEIADMRSELRRGNRSVFSQSLVKAIEDKLARGEQTILLLNRRGFSTFVLCRECGLVLSCPNCNVSLIYHNADNLLKCHYCHHQERVPTLCPRCQSRYIRYFGAGTQKVEEEISKLFPQARVLRMDADTTQRKNAHSQMLERFAKQEVDILLGTQMIAKGLDFPSVTLVGVITADILLNFPDFRGAEKTFQLLTQVAGRAGRGKNPGQVIIQTYCPDHYSIKSAENHDFLGFYQQEIEYRKELGYPPFSHLAKITIKGEEEKIVISKAEEAGQLWQEYAKDTEVLGPIPAPLSKVRGQYRWQIILKSKNLDQLRANIEDWWKKWNSGYQNSQVGIIIDIEPLGML